ncbi:MAG: reverse transcriptase-like protein [Thermoplasmata archaeon]|nr:reverse transcriptase-like protein [Thermoplasmata archaeon]
MRAAYLETDASVDTSHEVTGTEDRVFSAGAGIILRDVTLRPVLLKSVPLGLVPGAFHAEFLALICGLEEADGLGVRGVWATTDSKPVVEFIESRPAKVGANVLPIEIRFETARSKFAFVTLRWSHGSHRKLKFGGPSADALARAALGLGKRK